MNSMIKYVAALSLLLMAGASSASNLCGSAFPSSVNVGLDRTARQIDVHQQAQQIINASLSPAQQLQVQSGCTFQAVLSDGAVSNLRVINWPAFPCCRTDTVVDENGNVIIDNTTTEDPVDFTFDLDGNSGGGGDTGGGGGTSGGDASCRYDRNGNGLPTNHAGCPDDEPQSDPMIGF